MSGRCVQIHFASTDTTLDAAFELEVKPTSAIEWHAAGMFESYDGAEAKAIFYMYKTNADGLLHTITPMLARVAVARGRDRRPALRSVRRRRARNAFRSSVLRLVRAPAIDSAEIA